MIIHQREISYSENYAEFFEALVKAKAHMEKNFLKSRWSSCTIWLDKEVG